ncbi:hypothetical protein P7C73_g4954, partial [Tremellales sp. Uapishka_1]
MRKLLILWGVLDIFLLASGVISIAFSFIWAKPNVLLNMIFEQVNLKLGLVLGIVYIVSCLLSIPGIMSPNEKTGMLKVLNFKLIVDSTLTFVIGTVIWFYSLRQRAEYSVVWGEQTPGVQQEIQDTVRLRLPHLLSSSALSSHAAVTGLSAFLSIHRELKASSRNGTASGQFTTEQGFCSDTTFAANQTGCITEITAKTDYTLNNVFTTIYGFETIVVCFFVATVCVINERCIAVRFARIDEKRGGGGFV